MDRYCQSFGFAKYPKKTHPESIYSDPESKPMAYADGSIYFVEGDSIGSEFGFPRVSIKKRYRWKKMNFTTDLPKKRPEVTYIVASAVKCERFFPNSKNEGPLFRMHAVMLFKNEQPSKQTVCSESHYEQPKRYVLCHIRKLDASYRASTPVLTTDDKKKKQSNEETHGACEPEESPREDKSEAKESTSLLELTPQGAQLSQSFQGGIDYFRLFRHLHNLHCLGKDLE